MSELDDADVSALTRQVRTYPPLDLVEVAQLLAAAASPGPAQERLVEHHLRVALDEALARRDQGVDVTDLYQEATLATLVAVREYSSRRGDPTGLRAYVARVVGVHLDDAIEEARIERQADEAFVRDAQLYETAEINLRHELGRGATPTELAAVLEWPEERVVIVADAVNAAREAWDTDIVQYLDDE
ncbi:MAG: hypothetical protein ABR498_04635 [Candidatus Dormibacteria bacterium]